MITLVFTRRSLGAPSSDPFSFLAMAVPMMILYELSILVGRLLKK